MRTKGKCWWLLAAAGCGGWLAAAWAAEPTFRPAQPSLQPMVADVRVAVMGPRGGTRVEVRAVRAWGRVEGGFAGSRARVELGFRQGEEYLVSKTITVPVGSEFSETLIMPGDGPYTFYAAVVSYRHLVRSEDVMIRPPEGRDCSRGSRAALSVHLADDRGRSLDGRVVLRQGAAVYTEGHTAGGDVEFCDLPGGEYFLTAASTGGLSAPGRTVRVPGSGPAVVYVLNLR